MRLLRHLAPAVLTLPLLAVVACEPEESSDPDFGSPGASRGVADGTLIGTAGSLRLIRVENRSGAPGCEGAPRPDLRAVDGVGGASVDPAPDLSLSAGGNRVFAAPDGERLALATFCEGFFDDVRLAEVAEGRITDVRSLPPLQPAPGGPFQVTGWSQDGARFLGTATGTGDDPGAHRILAVDAATGEVRDTGVAGYWADDLTGGDLVVDQGDHVMVGDQTVAVDAGGADTARHLAVDPVGERVAVGTGSGLVVIGRDGTTTPWSSEPVRGTPAWSPDGRALAYVTGADGALTGELHVVERGRRPNTVATSVVSYEPVAFAGTGAEPALAYTLAGADVTDLASRRVAEVPFPAPTGTPTTPRAYNAALEDAWAHGDRSTVERLAAPAVVGLLAVRTPDPGDDWHGAVSHGAAGSTYTTWDGSGERLTIRVGNAAVARGADHAATEAFFRPGGDAVALWPVRTLAEAADQQRRADHGVAAWMTDAEAVVHAYAASQLRWGGAAVVPSLGADTYRVTAADGRRSVEVTVFQPVTSGPGGIWAVNRLASASQR